ncbi:hypothetical protein AB1Y20_010048 [Prymnesium parvum]|uniref:Uncharacterized protein n=1 Tax=Prymnesium parvum TaxID=97485 RepID=A0AB34K7S8_PRYPA|mmetsp:Transcript_6011/g.15276  ORF Transcript_6011/g.15276 Transcript_6011/m.15276 type:complete len:219 (+) Transcript_6011:31-687(+)
MAAEGRRREWNEWLSDVVLSDPPEYSLLPEPSAKLWPLIARLPPKDMRLPKPLRLFDSTVLRRFELQGAPSQDDEEDPTHLPGLTSAGSCASDAIGDHASGGDATGGNGRRSGEKLLLAKIQTQATELFLAHGDRSLWASDPKDLSARDVASSLISRMEKLEKLKSDHPNDAQLAERCKNLIANLRKYKLSIKTSRGKPEGHAAAGSMSQKRPRDNGA